MQLIDLNGVDLFLVIFIGFFFIRGLMKGFVYQVARIAAIILGFILAAAFSDPVGRAIGVTFPGVEQPWDVYIAYVVILGLTWGVLAYVAHLLKKRLERENLAFLDRLWGGVVGALKACLMIMVAVFALTALPGGGTLASPLRSSKVVPGVYGLMEKMTFLFPETVLEKGRMIFEIPDEIRPAQPSEPAADSTAAATSEEPNAAPERDSISEDEE